MSKWKMKKARRITARKFGECEEAWARVPTRHARVRALRFEQAEDGASGDADPLRTIAELSGDFFQRSF